MDIIESATRIDEQDTGRLSCFYCGHDITREQQAAGGRRYIGGDVCAYAHTGCVERRREQLSQGRKRRER
jgi:hypothetical protein